MPSVDVLCAVGTNGTPYAEFMKKSALTLKTSNADFRWKCIMGLDRAKKYAVPEGFSSVGRSSNKQDHASINHTNSMHELLSAADADYTIIADVDIAFLKKGWDEDMFKYLKKYDSFGIAWADYESKYQNFPSIMMIAFKTELIQELDWDLTPRIKPKHKEAINRISCDKNDARINEVKVGACIKQDSGWLIPYFFKNAGKTGFAVPKIGVGKKGSQLPFFSSKEKSFCMKHPTHMSEYVLDAKLYATHLQACRSKPWDGKDATCWRRRINAYLMAEYKIDLQ